MLHRHISLTDEDENLPKEAQYADNGQRFRACEMVDFNSLYVSDTYFLVQCIIL